MSDITTRLREDLDLAAKTLRRYQELHIAKGTPESMGKASANAALAERFEATLATVAAESDVQLSPYEPHNVATQRTGQAKTLLTCGARDDDECGQWYSPDAVRSILADAHAHYNAQVVSHTALAYVRDMVLNDRGPLEGMGMTNDQTNAVLAIVDAAMTEQK